MQRLVQGRARHGSAHFRAAEWWKRCAKLTLHFQVRNHLRARCLLDDELAQCRLTAAQQAGGSETTAVGQGSGIRHRLWFCLKQSRQFSRLRHLSCFLLYAEFESSPDWFAGVAAAVVGGQGYMLLQTSDIYGNRRTNSTGDPPSALSLLYFQSFHSVLHLLVRLLSLALSLLLVDPQIW